MSDSATDFAAMAAPVEAHQKLSAFEGRFQAEVKMWMGPGDPHVSTGTMENKLVLGGRFLQEEYVGDAVEGPFPNFEGKGFWGFNTQSQKYEGFWIDSASTMMQTEEGEVNAAGDEWTMVGSMKCPQTGQLMSKRSVIKLIDQDHHSMETYFAGADGNEMKAMEIQYRRI